MASGVERVDVESARRQIAAEEAQALDLRSDEEWRESHIAGAVRDPSELQEGKPVVVIGDEDGSGDAAEDLAGRGFEVSVLKGGMDAWKSEDFNVQPSPDPDDDAPVEPAD